MHDRSGRQYVTGGIEFAAKVCVWAYEFSVIKKEKRTIYTKRIIERSAHNIVRFSAELN